MGQTLLRKEPQSMNAFAF